jgi:hypothetical protein
MIRGEQVVYSLRLKRLWHDAEGVPRGPAELMITALPECDDTGKVIRVIGFSMDVSHLRHQARIQRVRMEEALEARKNQEMFYDTVFCPDDKDREWNTDETVAGLSRDQESSIGVS